ncbi:tyrosine-type recombinase/integrase [Blautia marasmi]|uniref:Tyrosine-type recombinase/integrase n=1 Tax=Blautia caccae TaxID=3133175 RepID=A0ABV1DV59_9FIRM|nr:MULTISPECIES: tyrosine-type recombinase/integrase [Blautia]MCQ4648727.1 tyrosine-type recombinase/integrase [Blautia marasmi]
MTRPHALRHTFCSRCFEKGITPKVVQQLMGHAHYSTTIDI